MLGIGVFILAANWFMGTWNVFLNLIITIIAAMVASSYFEILAEMIDERQPTYTYFADFVALWGLFFATFLVVRVFAEFLSKYRMRLNMWVDFSMRTVLGMAMAWVFICFTFFTLHTAPIPWSWLGFQSTPQTTNALVGPDRMWMQFMQSRSRWALSESRNGLLFAPDTRPEHPDDEGRDCRVFDPHGEFIFKYAARRQALAFEEQLRVNRQ